MHPPALSWNGPSFPDMRDSAPSALSLAAFNASPVGDPLLRQQLRTTHRRVWAGSQHMRSCIITEIRKLDCCHILELGAGTGWLGLNLAAECASVHRMTLSEHPDALQSLNDHVRRVAAELPQVTRCVSTVQFEWGSTVDEVPSGPFDLIYGADLVYSMATLRLLPIALRALLRESGHHTRALLQHTSGRKREVDAALESEFLSAGLRLLDVTDDYVAAVQSPVVEAARAEHGAESPEEASQGEEEEEAMPWLTDGGLFSVEDACCRQSRSPACRIFAVSLANASPDGRQAAAREEG